MSGDLSRQKHPSFPTWGLTESLRRANSHTRMLLWACSLGGLFQGWLVYATPPPCDSLPREFSCGSHQRCVTSAPRMFIVLLIITVNSNLNAMTLGDRLKEQCCVRAAEYSSAVNDGALSELTQTKFWAGLWQNMVTG